ncbi:unnamed protein product [Cyprideis torosa]|uniref:Uncharacterized protein n=1 Tax=Cyprideis torosa TaxID=163714 RepID=A0A7R8WAD3_9CRUS|nr:unnamed protein product [Cyprideis torosa]CAG0885750.1 unnamed protein product [Cyprideis torosa]
MSKKQGLSRPQGHEVGWVEASDPDLGDSGKVTFNFAVSSEGLITVLSPLAGKGRPEAYHLQIEATDSGTPPLTSMVPVSIFVGDVSSNDGIPKILKPKIGENVTVMENAPAGTAVFQVFAHDPDDPKSPQGKLRYSLLDDLSVFKIDQNSGLIRTRIPLDREVRDEYPLMVIVQDRGVPPQQDSRAVKVIVEDKDDHRPRFRDSRAVKVIVEDKDDHRPRFRTRKSMKVISIPEELPAGSLVGEIECVDEDVGPNAEIDYHLTYSTAPEGAFRLATSSDFKRGELFVDGRLDREEFEGFDLVARCLPRGEAPKRSRQANDDSSLSIRIKLLDIDDNPIRFKNPTTVGLRPSAAVNSLVVTLEPYDLDLLPSKNSERQPWMAGRSLSQKSDAKSPFQFTIGSARFFPTFPDRNDPMGSAPVPAENAFYIDEQGGLRLNSGFPKLLSEASHAAAPSGRFEVVVLAKNRVRQEKSLSSATGSSANSVNTGGSEAAMLAIQIHMIPESELLRFVFDDHHREVQRRAGEFVSKVEAAMEAPLHLHLQPPEVRDEYPLMVIVQDRGVPPQQDSRAVKVIVEDKDDHRPRFRTRKSMKVISIPEELPAGSLVGEIECVDEDVGPNAEIDYHLTYSTAPEGAFRLATSSDFKRGELFVDGRLDREEFEGFDLVARCLPRGEAPKRSRQANDDSSLSIRIKLLDIDDNPIRFKNPTTVGLRPSAAVNSLVVTLEPYDLDLLPSKNSERQPWMAGRSLSQKSDAKSPFQFTIGSARFFPTFPDRNDPMGSAPVPAENAFYIDEQGGLRLNSGFPKLLSEASHAAAPSGRFEVVVLAKNRVRQEKSLSSATGSSANSVNTGGSEAAMLAIQIHMIPESELLRFVFDDHHREVQRRAGEFVSKVEAAMEAPLHLHLQPPEYFVNQRSGRIDIARTSTCFQLVNDRQEIVSQEDAKYFLDPEKFKNIYDEFGVLALESCTAKTSGYHFRWIELAILVVSGVILIGGAVSAIWISARYSRYKREERRSQYRRMNAPTILAAPSVISPPMSPPPPSIISFQNLYDLDTESRNYVAAV